MRYCVAFLFVSISLPIFSMAPRVNLNKAIDRVITRYGLPQEPKLQSYFKKANVSYPPKEIALLAFKKERNIELWAKGKSSNWNYIHAYPLTAYSGKLGPKLKENDLQIPEGIYHLTAFNPYSAYHLSMMINYPNEFDKTKAQKDGRNKLGDNIFLHGKDTSVGCLAIGNKAIDQLFLLTRRVGLKKVKVVIAPNDLRKSKPATNQSGQPKWLPDLYKTIKIALKDFHSKTNRA